MLDIIGAGFGRTGTLSLKIALERLGFTPCYHMLELFQHPEQVPLWERVARNEHVDWAEVYRGYRATVDWPGVRYWSELTTRFPQAKVILTVRDPQRWYDSAAGTIHKVATSAHPEPPDPVLERSFKLARRIVWDDEFAGRFADADYAIKIFNEHNEAVRREIPADRLLVYEVGQGWEPLCAFLGVPVPAEPFPRYNDREQFTTMVRERAMGKPLS